MTTPGLARLSAALRRLTAIEGGGPFNWVDFADQALDPAQEIGRTFHADSSLQTMTEFGDVIIRIGETLQLPCVNKEGSAISKGQAVYISGAQGQRMAVKLADNTDFATFAVIGLAAHDIANNANGRVTAAGLVRDLDTSSFSVGDSVFVSTSGNLTATAPTAAGTYAVHAGQIIQSHANNGTVQVFLQYSGTLASTTANRPSTPRVGGEYFDTTLGIPIWWDGTNWVNSVGTTV